MATITPGELAELPPSLLNTLPALPSPAGVEPNFVNPMDKAYILNSVATVLFCLMVCLFTNRVYTKLFIIRKASWDNLICIIGFLGAIALYIVDLWSKTLNNIELRRDALLTWHR